MTVYVVMGETGEYSDRSEWPVWYRHNEPTAEADVVRLTQQADAACVGGHHYTAKERYSGDDPDFSADYTGTRYYVMTVKRGGCGVSTTELNRRVANAMQLTEFDESARFWQMDDGLPACKWYDGSAWADSADLALQELWHDLAATQHSITIASCYIGVNHDPSMLLVAEFAGERLTPAIVASTITEAWLAVHEQVSINKETTK